MRPVFYYQVSTYAYLGYLNIFWKGHFTNNTNCHYYQSSHVSKRCLKRTPSVRFQNTCFLFKRSFLELIQPVGIDLNHKWSSKNVFLRSPHKMYAICNRFTMITFWNCLKNSKSKCHITLLAPLGGFIDCRSLREGLSPFGIYDVLPTYYWPDFQ